MDRYDEARDRRTDDVRNDDVRNDDVRNDDVRNDDDTARSGDVLGLGGAAVPKMPGDPSASNDRERALGEDADEATRTEDPDRQRSGATGIDMGSGGQGTHISGK